MYLQVNTLKRLKRKANKLLFAQEKYFLQRVTEDFDAFN